MPDFDRNQCRLYTAYTIMSFLVCGCSANLEPPLAKERQTLEPSWDGGETDAGLCPSTALSNTFDGATENADTTPGALANVRLNELAIDPPGADGNNEFIEISGHPCTNLEGLYLVTIEGDSESNPGNVDRIFNFQTLCGNQPCQLGSLGDLVLMATNGWQEPSDSTATWVFSNALVGGGLENGTTTLLLVECSVPPSAGSDWDLDDTGVLQIPSTCREADSLSWLDRTAGDFAYSATKIGPKPSPQGAVRCVGPQGSPWWYFGALGSDLQGVVFMGTLSVAPKGAALLTPGMPNDCATEAPAADAATFSDAGGSPVPDTLKDKTVDASTGDVNSPEPVMDGGPLSTGFDAASAPIPSGSSKWWEPDTVGTWSDSGASFDASTLKGSVESTGSRGAPSVPQASCSLAANGRLGGFNSCASSVIGAILWFMLRLRRVE